MRQFIPLTNISHKNPIRTLLIDPSTIQAVVEAPRSDETGGTYVFTPSGRFTVRETPTYVIQMLGGQIHYSEDGK